jgi:hypothetical protein
MDVGRERNDDSSFVEPHVAVLTLASGREIGENPFDEGVYVGAFWHAHVGG